MYTTTDTIFWPGFQVFQEHGILCQKTVSEIVYILIADTCAFGKMCRLDAIQPRDEENNNPLYFYFRRKRPDNPHLGLLDKTVKRYHFKKVIPGKYLQ